ncbi:M23 family metallopeptidase [Sphingomonas sp. AR_OL41]|uniref:M23 family metallopeptidase n=1 Tax=Sphingomonas sp. AR_OL41 TaxID=3042729 RepID=UPI00248103B2|nr:M23 family metallopeptidase [Sphingomonas sp. AR_OL41]MDH7973682.1 M23 family metallopeptidase [Sphingomonas sp. AR_OL41]
MPQVPIEQNQVGIAAVTDAKMRPADYSGTGFEALGAGLHQLGQGGEELAKALDERRLEQEKTRATALDNGFVRAAQQIRSGFLTQSGLNANGARPDAEKALADLRDQYLGQATTPRMRHMLTPVLDGRVTGILGEFDQHVAAQEVKAKGAESVSRVALAREEAASATDQQVRDMAIATGLGEIAAQNARDGLPAAVTTADQFKFRSTVHTEVLRNLIVGDNVDGAVAYHKEHQAEMTAADNLTANALLHDPLQARDTTAYVNGKMGAATAGDSSATFSYGDPYHGAGGTPVPGGQFGAPRDYGTHKGVDKPGPLGAPLYAMGAGTVQDVTHSPLGGTIVVMHMANGDVVKYDHLGKVNVKPGDSLTPDTQVGAVGMTGRTTGPHVHIEIIRDGKPLDPQQIIGHVQQSPQRHDLNALLGAVDADQNAGRITPEQALRYKGEIERRVGRDEQLQARTEEDAQRAALDQITALGGKKNGLGFTNMAQLDPAIVARLSPSTRLSLMTMAQENARAIQAQANGQDAFNLHMMSIYDPEGFKKTDLRMFQNKVTPGELASLAETQGKMRTGPGEDVDHGKIWSLIRDPIRGMPSIGVNPGNGSDLGKLTDANKRSRVMMQRVFTMVQADINSRLHGQRQPTDDEIQQSYDRAVRTVTVSGDHLRGVTARAYQLVSPASGVPDVDRQQITSAFSRRYHRTPSEQEIVDAYQQVQRR